MFALEKIDNVLTMNSIEMVKFINSTRKEEDAELTHSDFLKKVPKVLGEIGAGKFSASYLSSQNKELPCYYFPKREACLMAMSYSYELQAMIFDRWQELESQQPKLPTNLADALQLAADIERAKQQALIERDEAIRTKAEIGSRREATAMNTASQLRKELDRSKDYATVKRMSMLHHGIKFDWRKLKSAGIDLGIEAIEVFDQNYGSVKAYHNDVWLEAYAISIPKEV